MNNQQILDEIKNRFSKPIPFDFDVNDPRYTIKQMLHFVNSYNEVVNIILSEYHADPSVNGLNVAIGEQLKELMDIHFSN